MAAFRENCSRQISLFNRLTGGGETTRNFDECIALAAKFVDHSRVNPLMANLIDIAMADGYLAGSEQQLLEAYVEAPDQSRVEMCVKVIGEENSVATI